MSIQKFQDSFSDMASSNFSTMLDRFFNDSLASRGRVNSFSPHVDAYETEKSYEIEAALPGMKRENVKVDFHQGRLTIAGERQFRNEQNQRRYHMVESSFGSFQRSFQLPDTVNANGIEAFFEDGMLRVSVPKDEQKTMRHQIQIRGSQSAATGNGQISKRAGQQVTDVTVQQPTNEHNSNGSNGDSARKKNNTSERITELNGRSQNLEVDS